MGRKTSVYLADDILAALAADPRPLAEVIRAGLRQPDRIVWRATHEETGQMRGELLPVLAGAVLRLGRWTIEFLPGTVGRGRTAEQVGQLRAHGGEIILAEPGQPEPEPELGDRHIRFTQPGE